ncbi:hypothetical protein FBQ98_08835 [Gammaproteobacteria bacterium PRO6]|nr:hypothetical protein [Gammaproteobacteria bacterium PRO6]
MALTTPCWAYEISTHALITDHAYRDSVLNPSNPDSIAPILGFDRLDVDYPFSFTGDAENTPYHDEYAAINPATTLPAAGANYARVPQQQERKVLDDLVEKSAIPGASGEAVEQRIRSWLLRGAVREDDNDIILPVLGIWYNPDHRDNDPFGHILRATKHFYDPVYDRAFDYPNYCGTYTCVRSILWAMGRTNPLNPGSDLDDNARRNHFTWQDARNNYWWSLVLKRSGPNFIDDAIEDSKERLSRWATTINDLGHVIHLLQDAAQPQHVRNDAHGPPLAAAWPEGEADAAFESYTDYRVLRSRSDALAISIPTGNPLRRMYDDTLPTENNLPALRFGSPNYYPGGGGHVQFSTPVKFFTTRHIEPGMTETVLRSRRGLADLSNRSFFTAGTLPGYRECQPPGTSGCMPTSAPTYPLPPSDLTSSGYSEVSVPSGLRVHGRVVHLAEYAYPITDVIAPNYDQSANTLAAYGGKAPLVTKGIWRDIIPDDLQPQYLESTGYLITYNDMRYMADVMVPRAVGYSAGMIDFFFRGRLEVTSIDQSIFAVMNQGDPHTMDADGYPRKTGQPTKTFGFEAVRLMVRNATPAIVESGTGTNVPQGTGGTGARLVAIARYHRNACYKPDMSGERVQSYDSTIVEPSCAGNQPVRTSFQEISVSAPLTVAAGELDGAAVEKMFDFSDDPIPVNATDLFIQLAYRGPLGEEPDGIAVGSYDVSEPTFAAAWNNTDYFWNGSAWVAQNSSNPQKGVYSYWACAGVPSKFVYRYQGATGAFAMTTPPNPGYVRLAFLFGKPSSPNSRFAVRSVPIMQTSPSAQMRSGFTRGQIRQANKELVAPATLASPYLGCFQSPPTAAEYWCFDPVQKRRGIAFGDIAQPIYFSILDGTDVDSVPLPPWSSAQVRDGGEIKFNDAGALANCPPQPTAAPEEIEYLDWLEEAELLGEG